MALEAAGGGGGCVAVGGTEVATGGFVAAAVGDGTAVAAAVGEAATVGDGAEATADGDTDGAGLVPTAFVAVGSGLAALWVAVSGFAVGATESLPPQAAAIAEIRPAERRAAIKGRRIVEKLRIVVGSLNCTTPVGDADSRPQRVANRFG